MLHPFKAPPENRTLFGIGLSVLLIAFIFSYAHLLKLFQTGPLTIDTFDVVFRVVIWVFLGGIYLCTVKIEKQPFLLWNEERYSVDFYILSIIVLFGLSTIMAGIIGILFNNSNLYNFHHKMVLIDHLSKPVKFLGVVTAAFCEEFIFRGYLIPRLRMFFKDRWLPIIFSALLFSLGHVGYQTMFYILYTLAFGILTGYHYDKYHNLKVLIIFHFLLDYCGLILIK